MTDGGEGVAVPLSQQNNVRILLCGVPERWLLRWDQEIRG